MALSGSSWSEAGKLMLSVEEIEHFLDAIAARASVVLTTAYAAGSRVSEAVQLIVSSIERRTYQHR
ncbi:hypothetical protein [Bradyrhizobium sp. CCBAU 45389]|uniref:hypothetical protein n=1 Tax=Bradyrhizobium sp. CCBAU 45389 TaxID=858429 RepID=UPI0023057B03|nr:hypothetical protein [Bradyrhizobium sp. CCBAU 45389]MDA9398550.1 hypothetical protein [Bradyrhizobium sp. CCBAU 45389]